jgi:uncharacterized protein (TIGR03435 family)
MIRRRVLVTIGIAALALTPPVGAQSGSFEIASVKPSNPNPAGSLEAAPIVIPALGRLTAANATLRLLVFTAYQKHPFQVTGGPAWQNTNKFDIKAKAADGSATTDQILELLKTLLADRFKLRVHTETREMPIYALVVARNDGKTGAKLRLSTAACPDFKVQQQQELEALAKGGLSAIEPKPGETRPCAITTLPSTSAPGLIAVKATGQSMPSLTLLLTQLTGRPVVDKTRLTGLYDFELAIDLQTLMRLSADMGGTVPALPPGRPEAPSLMTQLQEDLGLKLDSQRGPGDVLVIDGAELPTPD